ncbi:ANKRD50, partial [Symbiodinium microadriaticum]
MRDLGSTLPDSSLRVKALERMTKTVLVANPDISFRINLTRAALQIDVMPDDTKVDQLHAQILSELEAAHHRSAKEADKDKLRDQEKGIGPQIVGKDAMLKSMLADAAAILHQTATPQANSVTQGTPVTIESLAAQLEGLRNMAQNYEALRKFGNSGSRRDALMAVFSQPYLKGVSTKVAASTGGKKVSTRFSAVDCSALRWWGRYVSLVIGFSFQGWRDTSGKGEGKEALHVIVGTNLDLPGMKNLDGFKGKGAGARAFALDGESGGDLPWSDEKIPTNEEELQENRIHFGCPEKVAIEPDDQDYWMEQSTGSDIAERHWYPYAVLELMRRWVMTKYLAPHLTVHSVKCDPGWFVAAYTPLGADKIEPGKKEFLRDLGFVFFEKTPTPFVCMVSSEEAGSSGDTRTVSSGVNSGRDEVQLDLTADEQPDSVTQLIGWDVSRGEEPPTVFEEADLAAYLEERGVASELERLSEIGVQEAVDLQFIYLEDLVEAGIPEVSARFAYNNTAEEMMRLQSIWDAYDEEEIQQVKKVDDSFYTPDVEALLSNLEAEKAYDWIRLQWKCTPLQRAEEGHPVTFLGVDVHVGRDEGGNYGFLLCQSGYIQELLRCYSIVPKQRAAPVPKEWFKDVPETESYSQEELRAAQKVTGELLWVTQRSRVDLAYAVAVMGSWTVKAPRVVKKIGMRLLEYLGVTCDYRLSLIPGADAYNGVTVFSDASFAPYGCNSVTGAVHIFPECHALRNVTSVN